MASDVQRTRFANLSPLQLYRILQLRSEVFVVEQECPYQELDDRDHEPETEHLWIEEEGAVVAVIRVLHDDDGSLRIGRVATAKSARGRGLAGTLIDAVVNDVVDVDVVMDVQTHLVDYYSRWGFVVDGDEFIQDGIPHTPMRRPALNSL
jgi:ElaA protein